MDENGRGRQRTPAEGNQEPRTVILGAGPAGLTAAYELVKHGRAVTVLEQDEQVGGIARTVVHDGYRFDIGGHRFFSKNEEIESLWTEILGDEMLARPRLSRIYYRGRYFAYPIKAFNALANLGPWEALLCAASYAWARLTPVRSPRSLEDWVRNQFGYRLFSIFFKTYTEKVWGIPTKELSADWAAQRIKGLSFLEVLRNALRPQHGGGSTVIKTLIDSFRYPRLGPGQLWEEVARQLAAKGSPVRHGLRVEEIRHRDGRVTEAVAQDRSGRRERFAGAHFVSSLPLRELVHALSPAAPPEVLHAADQLGYRDFLTVALVVDAEDLFPDNWIYVHDPGVKVGRIQNFKNWSPDMVPERRRTCLGLEYFCFEGDGLWASSDAELVALAGAELAQLGICSVEQVLDGVVVRQPKAYPVYDDSYQDHVATIRGYLQSRLPNLHAVGRNGMHKYNNQDHSMLTALLVARNIATGTRFDPWRVNGDAEYHEEVRESRPAGRLVPLPIAPSAVAASK